MLVISAPGKTSCAGCCTNKCRKETICVLRASKYDKEEGTKIFLGILLCHMHKKIVGPELMKNWEKKEQKQKTRKGQERAVVAFSLRGVDPEIKLESNAITKLAN